MPDRDHITVARLDVAAESAIAHRGAVVTPPREIPGIGCWAAILDSEGNEVGVREDRAG